MPYRYTQPSNWRAIRRRILARDDGRCYSPSPDVCIGDATQVDHLLAVTQGGGHGDENLAAICAPCHEVKNATERRAGIARRSQRLRRPARERHPGALGG